ncbi:copper homeostasis protein CutC [Carboxylicivirga sediminis]|uniref:PF03932 family protein CutC n=1 Tax=Carboxylicivirga sediminis TaxID=2006564 RepID=A0A941IUW6_9BACT|nr:copper homeostasis protein CutC [Carboxylicivirga sediminis]MBR8534886.1 copper homeostasis protein CutC [Carboxylicivirga sediminis]
MNNNYTFEICIDSVQSAINAQAAGAHRVELCDNLFEGGTTPSAGMIQQVKKMAPDVKLFVIIRPRGGDFVYSEHEISVMLDDIVMAKKLGADGIVSGCLKANGDIDAENTGKLIQASGNLPYTFHRAFDMCRNYSEALEQLIDLGASRILTSGMQQTAHLGINTLTEIIKQANNRIAILVGSGVKPENIAEIARKTGAEEFHFSARKEFASPMNFKNENINMGGVSGIPEFSRFYSDVDTIKCTIKAVMEI